ncbi:MAG: O-antigen ligase family protein [Bacteroidota bacterium]|nr:O-antigen ligase family protein [Bacteroidota bacterium]
MIWFSAALILEITSDTYRETRKDMTGFPDSILLRVLALVLVSTSVGVLVMQRSAKFPILHDLLGSMPGSIPPLGAFVIPAAWIGGVAAVFLPIAVASASVLSPKRIGRIPSSRRSGRAFLACIACVVILLISVSLSQSRTAILAAAGGLAVTGVFSGPKGRVAVGIGIAAMMLLIFLSPDAVLGPFLFAGKSSGLSLETLFTGRTEIWGRAIFAIRDFPWTGLGPASLSSPFLELYPCKFIPATRTMHAHSMPLQTALDIGIPGAVLFASVSLFFFSRLVMLRSCERVSRLERAGFLGTFASLFLFGMAEAFPLASPPFAALGVLYALAYRTVTASSLFPSRSGFLKKVSCYTCIAAAILMCALVFDFLFPAVSPMQGSFRTNICNVRVTRIILNPLHQKGTNGFCDNGRASWWLMGKAFAMNGDTSRRDSCWVSAIRSDPAVIALAYTADPSDRFLAESAYALYPSRANACFWLAEAVAKDEPDRAITLYRAGLRLKPRNGLAWKKLGDLLARSNPREALDAYVQSCLHGDPGANGCFLAGQIAEKLGDITSAIRYFRMSRYLGAHRRADELEILSP